MYVAGIGVLGHLLLYRVTVRNYRVPKAKGHELAYNTSHPSIL